MKDIIKHICLIPLTPILSKIVKEFFVEEHANPATLKTIADNQ